MIDQAPHSDSPLVLHVVASDAGFHLVTPATLAAATAAQVAADAAARYDTFGELRRSGVLDLLAERLESWELTVDGYVDAIERAAGRAPVAQDLAERLAALHDVDFDGDDDAPADDDDVRALHEIDNEIADVFAHTVQTRMLDDVPAELLHEFDAVRSPMFVDHRIGVIDPDRLDEVIAALAARGVTVHRN
jgi:hypothetical protein